jgi:hypothetical protein
MILTRVSVKLEQQLLEQQQNSGAAPMIQSANLEEVPLSEPVLNLSPWAVLSTSENLSPENNAINSYLLESHSQACFLSDLQHADLYVTNLSQ